VRTINKIAMSAILELSRFPSGARNRKPALPMNERPHFAALSDGVPEGKEPLVG
jgi:hypothetical protein